MADAHPFADRLGRIPSPPDARDYKLEDYVEAPLSAAKKDFTPLDTALAKLQASHAAAQDTKDFGKSVVDFLKGVAPTPTPTPPGPGTAKDWKDSQQLDQKATGHCVGFGCAQWHNTEPVPGTYTDDDGHALYYECKVIDGEPKAEDGSYVRSGAKALKNRGLLNAYAFASDLDTVKTFLLTQGPVIFGTDWTNDMFDPDANGFVKPTGGVAGGHCFLAVGYDKTADVFTFQNSWGASWGLNGYFKLHGTDVQKLFNSNAEACAAVELA